MTAVRVNLVHDLSSCMQQYNIASNGIELETENSLACSFKYQRDVNSYAQFLILADETKR